MKTIVLVALLATAGCSKKGPDCDAAIGKGMDNFAASAKATNPQMQEARMNVIGKLRGRLTERCNEDKWPPEVVSCFATVASLKEMQACQGKLNEDQRTKLLSEIRQVMMGARGDSRMPPGLGGHPPMLGSPGPGAPGGDTAGSAAPAESPPPAGSAPAAAGSAAAPAPTGSAAPSPAGGSN